MKQMIRVPLAALALTASLSAPLLAETVTECQDRVIAECDAALADSNWIEKIAVGVVCVGRLAVCGGVSLTVNAT
jgi:hypothetical protein